MRLGAWALALVVIISLADRHEISATQTEPVNRPLITKGLSLASAGRMDEATAVLHKALDVATEPTIPSASATRVVRSPKSMRDKATTLPPLRCSTGRGSPTKKSRHAKRSVTS